MKFFTTKQLLFTLVPSALALIVVILLNQYFKISMYEIFRDPSQIAKISPFAGVMSNLGVLLWWSTASVCYFTVIFLNMFKQSEKFWFMFASALLSAYLTADDLFRIHDSVAWYLGLQEELSLMALGVVVLAYFIKFRCDILQSNFLILLLALGFLTASVIVDHFQDDVALSSLGEWRIFFEDGFKWLGIVFWCSYYTLTSYQILCCNFKQLYNTDKSTTRP